MNKVYGYELKRMFGNGLYWLLLAMVCALACLEFFGEVLYGVYDTAPFSPWSLIAYWNRMTGLMLVIPLYWVARNSAPKLRLLQTVTGATPVPASRQAAVRAGAGLTGFVSLVLVALAVLLGGYGAVFGSVPLTGLAGVSLLLLVPTALFAYGVALWLGRVSPILIYMLMAVFLSMTLLELRMPMAIDFLGTSVMALGAIGTLTNGVIPFSLPAPYIISRIAFAMIGAALIVLACRREDKKA